MENTDLAYIAGIIDGEGSITIHKVKGHHGEVNPVYCLFVRVCNTNPAMIQYLHNMCGGCQRYSPRNKREQDKRSLYEWVIASKQAEKLLKTISSYITCKQDEIKIALLLRETQNNRLHNGSQQVPAIILQQREILYQKLIKLHHRTYKNPFSKEVANG